MQIIFDVREEWSIWQTELCSRSNKVTVTSRHLGSVVFRKRPRLAICCSYKKCYCFRQEYLPQNNRWLPILPPPAPSLRGDPRGFRSWMEVKERTEAGVSFPFLLAYLIYSSILHKSIQFISSYVQYFFF
jgi:hypothetical protein